MLELLQQSIAKIPGIEGQSSLVTNAIAMVAICLIAIVTFYIFKYGLIRLITKLISKTKSSLDDVLIRQKVFNRIAYLLPAYLLYLSLIHI